MKRHLFSLFFATLTALFAQPNDIFEAAKSTNLTPQNLPTNTTLATPATPMAQPVAPTPTLTSPKPTPSSKKITIKDATLQAINSLRAMPQICAQPTTPLVWSESLYNAAKEHALDMAVNNMLSHEGSGTNTDITAKKLGLNRGSHFYERVNKEKDSKKALSGELLLAVSANAMKTPKEVLNYWINRSNDCKVIMDKRFSKVALSKVINNKTQKAYWVLLLAGARAK
jgi:uncharacterized protein YkwD